MTDQFKQKAFKHLKEGDKFNLVENGDWFEKLDGDSYASEKAGYHGVMVDVEVQCFYIPA